MTNKITPNLSYELYREIEGINISTLKELGHSPMHYQHRLTNPKQTTALRLGTAAHKAVLEPDKFLTGYAVWDRVTDGGNTAPRRGQWWDAFCAENADKEILSFDEHLAAKDIAKAVRECQEAMRYLNKGYPEVVMQWEMHGRQCKGRVDWLCKVDDRPVLVGLKTARDCRQFEFGKQAAYLGYHMQWAWYFDGYSTIKEGIIPRMVEIVVESGDVPAVVVYEITIETLDQGRKEYLELLTKLAECEASGKWAGPYEGEQVLMLPSWAYDESDVTIEVEETDNG